MPTYLPASTQPAPMGQFARFVVIGVMNTAIDFIVLNILMLATGIQSGLFMFVLNAISFSVATINSYFFNKKWTFQDKSQVEEGKKFSHFLAVSVIGVSINSLVVALGTTYLPPFLNLGFAQDLVRMVFGTDANMDLWWANIVKIAATGISLIWNFLGYKFFVFKR